MKTTSFSDQNYSIVSTRTRQKADAVSFAADMIAAGQFKAGQLALMCSEDRKVWAVAREKAAAKTPAIARERVRNPNGYRAVEPKGVMV